MKKSEIYEITHDCYAEILAELENRMDVNHWSYAYLREKADEHLKRHFALVDSGDHVGAHEELEKHSEAMEQISTRISAYGNLYKVVAKHLGMNVD